MAKKKSKKKSKKKEGEEEKTLTCPQCGNNNGSSFQLWEDVIASRDVFGFNKKGVLEISGSSSPGDDSENDRLVCMSCMKDFPIPDDIEVEYV